MADDSGKHQQKQYDYLLKFLLVGDSDVGKQEILSDLDDGSSESPFCGYSVLTTAYKTTTILLEGKRVKLQLWDASGQGRFCTIIRSYSRGAQGVLLVYDITNRWSFDGLDRWLKEVDEHAPGVPKVLVGNRLHLAFNRKVGQRDAQLYADKHSMAFFEVSPLCNFNIHESFSELSRMALQRNGMERLWRSNKVVSLQELCCRCIVSRAASAYGIERLPLPPCLKSHLKSYATSSVAAAIGPPYLGGPPSKGARRKQRKLVRRPLMSSASATDHQSMLPADSTSCVPRNSCVIS
ncbi:unnamed protein product [Acanthoscelides obtectus]|uniref:small monomeric GTPase n=1 Tax=Acanthoscelides obtectus TaxID=200917 RepID=A0A9P0LVI1_ACAOB|nr:unnamed protein product [Acanthoscelides obtectus]CAK1671484.1 Ras-related protein Rab-40C [Acanthoscelides obtectus]